LATVRKLLEECPGEPLCDACLAFACSVSLAEMRAVTGTVASGEPFTRDTATCASCRRQTTTLAWTLRPADDNCVHCSRAIHASDGVEVVDTDRFHRQCWARLMSAEHVRTSKALSRRSHELIRRSREGMGLRPPEDVAEA
jgi:hypothetical protein